MIRQSVRFVVSMGFVGALAWGVQAAEIDLDKEDKRSPVATYAEEALSKADADTQKGTEDKKIYYKVTSSPAWTVKSVVGFGISPEDRALIRYDFENMVLAADLGTQATLGAGTLLRRTGGAAGDSYVVYSVTPTDAVEGDEELTLALGNQVAISPDAPASVRMTITLPGLVGVVDPYEARYSSAIVVAKGTVGESCR